MDRNRKGVAVKEQMTNELHKTRTTIGLRMATKDKLDKNRAPGQCYDGFVRKLVDLWEGIEGKKQDYVINLKRGG